MIMMMRSATWLPWSQRLYRSSHKRYPRHRIVSLRPMSALCQNKTTPARQHVPVMSQEVVALLKPREGQVIIDMTFGAGGHTGAILGECPRVRMFCVDRDPLCHDAALKLAQTSTGIVPLLGKFSEVGVLLEHYHLAKNSVDAVLFDVGGSSMQFDNPERGFSLAQDGPLDMRMDSGRIDQVTAADVINHLDENKLYKIFKKYGEEKKARLIANAIVDSRYAFGKITRTQQLAQVVASVFEGSHRRDKLSRHAHVATKVFQALRIFVNDELNELNNGLTIANHLLKPGGICVALSFQSLEDRIIKRHFQGIDMDTKLNMSITDHHRVGKKIYGHDVLEKVMHSDWNLAFKGAMLPKEEDVIKNPRSRSAKLRAAYKAGTSCQ